MIDTDDIGSNESGNPHLADMIEAQLSRRSVLTGGVALAATGFFGGALLQSGQATARSFGRNQALGFDEVPARRIEHSAEQALQVGFNHDGMHYFPLGRGPRVATAAACSCSTTSTPTPTRSTPLHRDPRSPPTTQAARRSPRRSPPTASRSSRGHSS
jgi:secreted PhoX family phosphatase